MKAIFLKEIRENFKWAILGMLVMGGFFEWAIRESGAPELISDSFFFATITGFSMIALALGLLQIFQDEWRGREAFIIHRPIKRSAVFSGKILAGLLLYFLAAGLPLAVAIGWCYTHRYRTAPFEWRMAWPGIWDLINGTVVYFAALLIGSRDARWFGSRVMPLSAPFFATSIGYFFAGNIGQALLITVIALLVVIPAAWSSYVHRGIFENQSLFIRAIQTTIITLGLMLCVWTINGFVLSNLSLGQNHHGSGWDYIIDDNGQLLRRIFEDSAEFRTVDLAGNTVPTQPQRSIVYLPWPRNIGDLPVLSRGRNGFHQRGSYLRGILFDGADSRNEILVYSVHRRVIDEFDEIHGRWIGTIGQDGFVSAPQAARPFERPLLGSLRADGYLGDSKNVYHIGLDGAHLKTVMTAPADDQVSSIARFGKTTDEHPYYPYLAVLTIKSLKVFADDREIFSFAPPFGPPIYNYLWITSISDGHFSIFFQPDSRLDASAIAHLIELDERGQVVKQVDAPATPNGYRSWWIDFPLTFLPSPLGLFALGSLASDSFAPLYIFVEMAGIAMVCGLVAGWWTQKFPLAPAARATWIIVSALMGVPGLLGLFAMRSWPLRVKCRSCNRLRIVTRESCEHCAAPFATRAMVGIEIFE